MRVEGTRYFYLANIPAPAAWAINSLKSDSRKELEQIASDTYKITRLS